MESDIDKQKAIKTLLAKINKDFGDGAIMTLDEFGETEIDCISTGCVGLDIALGGKGMPRGRIVEIIGHESSSKQPSRCISAILYKRLADRLLLLMLSTPLILSGRSVSVSMLLECTSRNHLMVKRHYK